MASHDMAEVESLCDRIAILNGGNLAYLGTVAQLTAKIGKRYAIRITTGRGTETYHSDHIAETLLELLEKLKRQGIAVLDNFSMAVSMLAGMAAAVIMSLL